MGSEATREGQPEVTTVRFDSGQDATLVRAGPAAGPDSVIEALGLKPRIGQPVLLVSSGSADVESDALTLATNSVGKALARAGPLVSPTVIDDAVTRGIAVITGATRAQAPDAVPVLLGVAAAGAIENPGATSPGGTPLESHHTHVVLADSARWDGERDLRFALATTLAGPAATVLLVVGGDDVAKAEIHAALERQWPVLVAGGTGGISDQIAREWLSRHDPPQSTLARRLPKRLARHLPARLSRKRAPALDKIADENMRRIVGDPHLRGLPGEPGKIARQIAWELHDESVLKDVWSTFASYDALAARVRRSFEHFQNSILLLGVLATLVALLASATKSVPLYWLAVAAPIVVSSVIALANRRGAGKRWVVLRATAEAIKGEIYRYRTRTGVYADSQLPNQDPGTRPNVLAGRIKRLVQALMHTEASSGHLPEYSGPLPPVMYGASEDDDGLSRMDAPTYLAFRVEDQVKYYDGRVKQLDTRREWLQRLGIGAGGAGAIVVAAGAAAWVGLTTAISGAALSYLGYLQVDNTIVTYNQTKASLRMLGRDWKAQGIAAQTPAAFEKLVSDSESVLSLELSGWVRQMTQTVDELQSEQKKAGTPTGGDAPGSNGTIAAGRAPAKPTEPTAHDAEPTAHNTEPTAPAAEPTAP